MARQLRPQVEISNEDWREKALCFDYATNEAYMVGAWDDPKHPLRSQAISICKNECGVSQECTISALMDPHAEGLRGGFEFNAGGVVSADDRKEIRIEYGAKARRVRSKVYDDDEMADNVRNLSL